MTSSNPNPERDTLAEAFRARAAIEAAIATLKAHRTRMTEGQINDLKRIIYASHPPA
ncbi:hypothetical protein IQ265_12745 [Nodosilinea sp. LEGE 06152]|uniref:hypothetical protein n=1 Tax=Nodosilinea sp. LEGE 06152 TaxID=2777966 RepID=UPI00188284FB|nr:hypothetical protein [Nodosilinea sp. LEGE 06152]MBE9157687.1 hypothetical protein [Nodosilinea sp. LEGE 06152]